MRRVALGLSQSVVAKRMGITFQQIQKYENGKNTLSVARLYEMASALEWNALSLLSSADTNASNSTEKTRASLEIVKRINLLQPHEFQAVAAFLNALCRDRRAA